MNIAFVGLGNMGTPMARNLLKAGHHVTVFNRNVSRAKALEAEGARVAYSPSMAASDADVVFTMLADDHAVEEVVFVDAGLLEGLKQGAIHVSSSTISVNLSRRLEEAHGHARQQYIAAPVFGRPDAAQAAKLFIVAGGHSSAIERCRPLFDVIGQRTFVVGVKPEMANVVKLSGNFLIASMIESLGEAVALIRKYGVDPHTYIDVLTNSLFNAPAYKTYGGLISDQHYSPAGFPMPLGLKDVRLALEAAGQEQVPMPVASLVRDRFLTAMARGHADLDWSAIALICAEDAGLR